MISFQINAFLVLAIFGCIFAAIQLLLAAVLASAIKRAYDPYLISDCDVCDTVSRFILQRQACMSTWV